MGEIGKYLYGITNSNAGELSGSCPSTQNSAAGAYVIPYKDISAVVGDAEIVNYSHMPKRSLAELLVEHQKTIENIMGLGCSIIPMRLGTFARDESEVKDILKKGYGLAKEIIGKTSVKIEIDVTAMWNDFQSVLKEISKEKEIKEFREKLLTNTKGVTVDDQMKAGVMVKKSLTARRQKHAFDIQNTLSIVSQDLRVHELMNDEMIANIAFLLSKDGCEEFDAKLEELNVEFAGKVNFRRVGPLPPYSFYTLEVKRLRFEDIDWARKKLGLGDSATKDEIKKAHQRVAFSCHPDRNPGVPGVEEEFGDLTRAYRILGDYCLATQQSGRGDVCVFNAGEFEKSAVLVKVRD